MRLDTVRVMSAFDETTRAQLGAIRVKTRTGPSPIKLAVLHNRPAAVLCLCALRLL